jgi:hypothetical protein
MPDASRTQIFFCDLLLNICGRRGIRPACAGREANLSGACPMLGEPKISFVIYR